MVLGSSNGPVVKLDDKFYKLVDKMDALTIAPPSLVQASSLTVKGPVKFAKGVVIKGDVLVVNGEPLRLFSSFYQVPEMSRNHRYIVGAIL